jgi:hypothetical protein
MKEKDEKIMKEEHNLTFYTPRHLATSRSGLTPGFKQAMQQAIQEDLKNLPRGSALGFVDLRGRLFEAALNHLKDVLDNHQPSSEEDES